MAGETGHQVWIRFSGKDDGVAAVAKQEQQAIEGVTTETKKAGHEADRAAKLFLAWKALTVVFDAIKGSLGGINDYLDRASDLAMEYETAITGLATSTDSLSDADIATLEHQFENLGIELGINAVALAGVAEEAAKLDLPADEVAEFTEAIGKGSKLFPEWSGGVQGLAQTVAQLNRQWKEGTDSVWPFIAMLDSLSDSTGVSGEAIAQFLQKFTMGPVLGVSREAAAALGTTLIQLGMEAGTAAGAANQLLTTIQTGGKDLEEMARLAGMGADEFKRLAGEDIIGALERLAVGMTRLQDTGRGAAYQLGGTADKSAEAKEATKEYEDALKDTESALTDMSRALSSADNNLDRYNDSIDRAEDLQRDAEDAFRASENAAWDGQRAWAEYEREQERIWQGYDAISGAFSTSADVQADKLRRLQAEQDAYAQATDRAAQAGMRCDDALSRGNQLLIDQDRAYEDADEYMTAYQEDMAAADEAQQRANEAQARANEIWGQFGQSIEASFTASESMTEAAGGLTTAMQTFGGEGGRMIALLGENMDQLSEAIDRSTQATKDQSGANEDLNEISKTTAETNASLKEAWNNVTRTLGEVKNNALQPVKELMGDILRNIGDQTDDLPGWLESWGEEQWWQDIREAILDASDSLAYDLGSSLNEIALYISQGEWSMAWKATKVMLSTLWEEIKPKLETLFYEMTPTLTQLKLDLANVFIDIGEAVGKGLIDALLEYLTTHEYSILEWFMKYLNPMNWPAMMGSAAFEAAFNRSANNSYEEQWWKEWEAAGGPGEGYFDEYGGWSGGGDGYQYEGDLPGGDPDSGAWNGGEGYYENSYGGAADVGAANPFAAYARQQEQAWVGAGRPISLHFDGIYDGESMSRHAPQLVAMLERAAMMGGYR